MITLKKEGDVLEMVNRILSLLVTLIVLTGCNQLAMLSVIGSTVSLAISNNTLSKLYSSTDVLTYIATNKDIKTHVYNIVDDVAIVKKIIKEEQPVLVSYPVVEVKISKLFRADEGFFTIKNKITEEIINHDERFFRKNYAKSADIKWEIEAEGWKVVWRNMYGG